MDEERRRILQMLSNGSITVEECEELLKALSQRRTEKVTREVEAVREKRPVWPYVLLVVLAVAAVTGYILLDMGGMPFLLPRFGLRFPVVWPLVAFGGLARLAAFAFWLWMLVDCITRLPCDFRLLFTSKHEYDKWIWVGVVVFTNWLGALAYLVLIRQYARTRVAAVPAEGASAARPAPAEPFIPSPRARSVIPFFLIGIMLALGAGLTPLLVGHAWPGPSDWRPHPAVGPLAIVLPLVVMGFWLTVFWFWMLIDCIVRDHRDFGTGFTTDRSAEKVLWLLLILFTFLIGAFAYHIAVRRRRRDLAAAR